MTTYAYTASAQYIDDGFGILQTQGYNGGQVGQSLESGDGVFMLDEFVAGAGLYKGTFVGTDGKVYLVFEESDSPITLNLFTTESVPPFPNPSLQDEYIDPLNPPDPLPPNTEELIIIPPVPGGDPVCFGLGTLITTAIGTTRVEDLSIGDEIRTADGGTTPVKWIGRQTVSKLFTPAERFAPVRISAGALGDGLPLRDLVLTGDHAVLIDGLLVQASALVNGTSIDRVPMAELPDQVTFYHVETEGHAIILAEGMPAETFVDNVTRKAFDNYAEFESLYGAEAGQIAEHDAPRVLSQRQLPASLRARIGVTQAA